MSRRAGSDKQSDKSDQSGAIAVSTERVNLSPAHCHAVAGLFASAVSLAQLHRVWHRLCDVRQVGEATCTEREVCPDAGIAQHQVVAYLLVMSDWLGSEIVGRPLLFAAGENRAQFSSSAAPRA